MELSAKMLNTILFCNQDSFLSKRTRVRFMPEWFKPFMHVAAKKDLTLWYLVAKGILRIVFDGGVLIRTQPTILLQIPC